MPMRVLVRGTPMAVRVLVEEIDLEQQLVLGEHL